MVKNKSYLLEIVLVTINHINFKLQKNKKRNDIMENKNIINMLIEKLEKLDDGVYYNDSGIRIDVHRGISTITFSADGVPKSNTPRIDVSYNGNGINIEIVLDKNSTLYINKDISNDIIKTYILTTRENKTYNIDKALGIDTDNIFYPVQKDILFKEIDNTCWLGYDLNENKIYVYYNKNLRKYNKPYETNDNEGFIKFEYNNDFPYELENFKRVLFDFFKEFKNSNKGAFKELLEFVALSLPTIRSDVDASAIELIDLGAIYNTYKNELVLEKHESELREVYNLVESVIIDPEEAVKNNIKHMIENIDVNNKEELVKLRTEIDNMLKPKKKTKKLKK